MAYNPMQALDEWLASDERSTRLEESDFEETDEQPVFTLNLRECRAVLLALHVARTQGYTTACDTDMLQLAGNIAAVTGEEL